MTQTVTQLYRGSGSGIELTDLLARSGFVLTQGRAGLCLKDGAGHLHSLRRRVRGVAAAELQAFLKDVPVIPSPV